IDLPVNEWKSYVFQKWFLFQKSIQVTISTEKTLSNIFPHSSLLLQPEDEMFLQSRKLEQTHNQQRNSISYQKSPNK
uniref:Uncharacterized protein n=1 Tax=Lynx canadensis TaxID=61383 RepID=A0A667GEN1_LYNCA